MSVLLIILVLCVVAALGCLLLPRLRAFAFGLWIVVAFLLPLQMPGPFLKWGDFDTAVLIVPLIQVIMFGMGTTRVLKKGRRTFFEILGGVLSLPCYC